MAARWAQARLPLRAGGANQRQLSAADHRIVDGRTQCAPVKVNSLMVCGAVEGTGSMLGVSAADKHLRHTLRVLRVKIVLAECGPSRSLRRVRSSRNQLQDGPKAAPCPPYATRTTCRAEEPASIDATALNGSSAGARSFAGDAVAFDEE